MGQVRSKNCGGGRPYNELGKYIRETVLGNWGGGGWGGGAEGARGENPEPSRDHQYVAARRKETGGTVGREWELNEHWWGGNNGADSRGSGREKTSEFLQVPKGTQVRMSINQRWRTENIETR